MRGTYARSEHFTLALKQINGYKTVFITLHKLILYDNVIGQEHTRAIIIFNFCSYSVSEYYRLMLIGDEDRNKRRHRLNVCSLLITRSGTPITKIPHTDESDVICSLAIRFHTLSPHTRKVFGGFSVPKALGVRATH